MNRKQIKSALVSVYHKDGLEEITRLLHTLNVKLYTTGGTYDFISGLGLEAVKVEDLTSYPSILGGRVKTLHPGVFGGILARRENSSDRAELEKYGIPETDLVIVDLYPFEETVRNTGTEEDIIEKIDIGGISLIRAAAKNHNDVLVISGRDQYADLVSLLKAGNGYTDAEQRRRFAAKAFMVSSNYDTAIFKYFNSTEPEPLPAFRESINTVYPLRYGENPHQKGVFFGNPDEIFTKLHGKELSYNNLLDLDSAVGLIDEFSTCTFAVIKHNNACGAASRENPLDAWKSALACDPVSAYGGVIVTNAAIEAGVAAEIDKLFFEIIIAPMFSDEAMAILTVKKNRIILARKNMEQQQYSYRSLLNGILWQEKDTDTRPANEFKTVTNRKPLDTETDDMIFANFIVKHSKSNAITLVKNRQLLASGVGQTSRVDALKQAIEKAGAFGFDLRGAVMASDAFFPFSDCVEIAHRAGITAVIQPGGSVRDQDSINYCTGNNMTMIFTGTRHFRH
ncbi:MAG: bifunctional phosphoribosylaminoimidazolecarboxamide formyltransferase/IMP cyclohydrolase [Bacteroidales bacterium]|jgi:phosphoribosylaminoimidazolecarboxamide formyltransferase/IMP cyclohydrolase|nr:bifunctional phosphoribosylaminoimidazolecarboxamide formyltransferase/IMP cyclohydrolase [Bacteroidales bacterium]